MVKIQVDGNGKAFLVGNKALEAQGGEIVNNQNKTFTENGSYTADIGYTGLGTVTVNVSSQAPVIQSLNVTPTTSSQTITAPSGVDGYTPVNVSAVTSSIDSNIVAGNIKKDVSILGVTGTYEGSGGGPNAYIPLEVSNGVLQKPSQSFSWSVPNGVTEITDYGLYFGFKFCLGLSSVSGLDKITTIKPYGLYSCFDNCSNLQGEVAFSNLENLSHHGFYGCFVGTKITKLSFPKLKSVPYDGLEQLAQSSQLASIELPVLESIVGNYGCYNMCANCLSLISVSFPMLKTLQVNYALGCAFKSCTNITDIYFPSLTTTSFGTSYITQFYNLVQYTGTTTTHTLHFPSNLESTISTLQGYPLFGGTSGYVVLSFDLPATE